METVTLKTIHSDIRKLYSDVELIKNLLFEKYELSGWAKEELKKARDTPENEYVSIDEVM